jgi:asparagine synthase (glutamine-hydrolysing)
LNRTAIVSYLIDHWPRLNETFYSRVKRIPPGHAMRVSRGTASVYRYWDPEPRESASRWITEDELGRFDELLACATDRYLALGPVGIYLSGGLDSVSVAAVATDRCAANRLPAPHALSLGFADPEANEQLTQRGVASRLGIPQDLVPFAVACGPEGLLLPILELSRSLSLPLQNFWLAAYNHLARLGKERGCRVIFTGAGGDEWLGLSPYLAADYIRSFDYSGLHQLWLGQHRSFPGPLLAKAWFLFWLFGIRALMRDATIRTLRKSRPSVYAAIMRRRIRSLVGQRPWLDVDEALLREIYQRAETSETERANESTRIGLYFAEGRRALDHPLVSWEMEEVFENGRRLNIRFLAPYYDAELIEMLYRVPQKLLIRGGRTKGLIRERVARRFPGLGFESQKKVQITRSFGTIMQREGPRAWQSLGGAKSLAAIGVVNAARIDRAINADIASGDHRDSFKAWSIMGIESWLRARI